MSAQDLERRVGRLEKTLTGISEELRLALRYVQPDAGSSLTKSRMILEKILLQVYGLEIGREPRKPLLGDMLADNQFTRKIDRRILSRMNAIRDMGNLGPHGASVKESDAVRVLEDLCEVLDWYLPLYAQPGGPPAAPAVPTPVVPRRWMPRVAVAVVVVAFTVAIGAWLWPRDGTHAAKQDDDPPVVPPAADTRKAAPSVAAAPVVVELGLALPPVRRKNSVTGDPSDETRVTHESTRKDGILYVKYRLPYLEKQRAGQAIQGISFQHDTFDWELPRLSVKVLNNSAQSVMLTECVVDVTKSVPDTEPVLAIADGAVNGILLINEGWGPVIDPVLTFKIQRIKKSESADTAERHQLELPTFATDRMVRLLKYVPKELEDEANLAVSGEIEFGQAPHRKKTAFATTMKTRATVEHNVPPSQQYDIGLTAGKAPETLQVPISHNLKAGEADQFLLRVLSDKSARYELTVRIRRIDGELLPAQKLDLDLFVPRSAAKRVAKAGAVEPPKPAPAPKQP